MPQYQTKGFKLNFRDKPEDPYTQELNKAINKSQKTKAELYEVLPPLYRSSQRAKGIRERLQQGRAILFQALRALLEKEDIDEADGVYLGYNTNKSNGFQGRAVSTSQRGLRAQEEAGRSPSASMRKLESLYDDLARDMEDNFGTRLPRTSKEINADLKLEMFFMDVRHILTMQSVLDLMKALCIWENAYQAQLEICGVYKEKKATKLKTEADNLVTKISAEQTKGQPNIYTIEKATDMMKQIRHEVNSLKLAKVDNENLHRAEQNLKRALDDMADLRQKVGSKGREKQRQNEGELYPKRPNKPRRFTLKRLVTHSRLDRAS